MWNYSEKTKEHFLNPRNVGTIDDATVIAEVGNISCGDALKLYLKIDENETITDVKFQTFGCGSAIAASSALSELIMGKTIEEAMKVTNETIAEYLGGLPEAKMHCSVMGQEALEKAVASFRGEELEEHNDDDGKIVCKCFGVTEPQIKRVIRENNLKTVEQVTHYCKAGGACGACINDIEDIIKAVTGISVSNTDTDTRPKKKLTNLQRIRMIEDVLEEQVRPGLKNDGGDIELIDVQFPRVIVELLGACKGCPMSGATMRGFVQAKLRELVDETIIVEEAEQE